MESKMLVFLCFLFLLGTYKNKACLEAERLALLEFKEFLNSEGYDADYLLPSWEDDPRSECCDWERVSCNRTTGHVTKLALESVRQSDDSTSWTHKGSESLLRLKKLETLDLYSNDFDEGIIPTLKGLSSLKNLNLGQNSVGQFPVKDLSSFEHLEVLNLNFCSLDGSLDDEGFENSSKLRNLNHLDLSFNSISENMFPFLGKLLSLEHLDLSDNNLDGAFPVNDILGLSNLEVLLLNGNHISGNLSIQNPTALSKLQVLDLTNNNLNDISLESGTLNSLKVLSLSGNDQLNDTAITALCVLKRLEELDLSRISLTRIPQCLYNFTSLELLDLSNNGLTGEVPSSWIATLTSLKYIDLEDNNLQGLFSFSVFNNHSHLEYVRVGSYNDGFRVETEDAAWIPTFQLKVLVLSKSNLNMYNHKVPSFLFQQRELRLVDLSDNNLKGRLPCWLLANNSRLEILVLNKNDFSGDFYMSLFPMMNLLSIDVSGNQIQGMLPENVGTVLPNLMWLKLSNNVFGGNLPSSIGLMRNLEVLDLSLNNFIGQVPESLYNCTNLSILKLSNNGFSRNFFSTRYNWSALEVLTLNDNKFMGSMSNVEVNSYGLFIFDISNNFMFGKVPTWIANVTRLLILNLRNNSLQGEVPCEGFAAYNVDLSHNLLTTTIPSCSTMEYLDEIHLESNNFTGSIPKALVNSSRLKLLNLRDNKLSGSIPDTISGLSSLRILLLRGNHLSGSIPKNLCLLKDITLMDLSYNSLSGSIPLCLSNISFLRTDDQSTFDGRISTSMGLGDRSFGLAYQLKRNLGEQLGDILVDSVVVTQVEFVAKSRYNTYKGDILNFMSGIDLSCNNLEGEIPPGVGNWSKIHAINLSHNHLIGLIPTTFANLTQIESLDLSHNSLTGEIPSQLTQLTFLGVFSVAYNNLSGRIPYGTAQFGTFKSRSYEGNPLLCGQPLEKQCGEDNKPVPPPPMRLLSNDVDEHWYDIDLVTFFASFSASFAIFCLGVVAFLYVNPYWHQWVLYYGEKIVLSGYHLVSDTVFMLSLRFRRGW